MDVTQLGSVNSFVVPSIVQPAGAYSHGVTANGFLFTCGIGPSGKDPNHSQLGDIADQTRRTFRNLEGILLEKGLAFDSVLKVTAYLHDIDRDFDVYDSICREFFKEPFPVRTTVGAKLRGILICIELVAKV